MPAAPKRQPREGAAVAKRLSRYDWLSTVASVIGVVTFVLVAGSGWSWPYFVWGLATGVVAVLGVRGVMQLMYVLLSPSPEEVAQSKQRIRERYRSVYVTTVIAGGVVGALAASTDSAWPDVVASLFILTSLALPFAMLPKLRRRERSPE